MELAGYEVLVLIGLGKERIDGTRWVRSVGIDWVG